MLGPGPQTWTSPSFASDKSFNQLLNTHGAEIRLGTMLIPGSPVAVEFVQYRNIEHKKYRPEFWDIGVAHLRSRFIAPTVRAIFVRDPNGFIVEFMERKSG